MADYKELSGSLFINDKKTQQNHPDYRGSIMIGGVIYSISGWVKQSQSGKQFLSLSAQVDTYRMAQLQNPQQAMPVQGFQQGFQQGAPQAMPYQAQAPAYPQPQQAMPYQQGAPIPPTPEQAPMPGYPRAQVAPIPSGPAPASAPIPQAAPQPEPDDLPF